MTELLKTPCSCSGNNPNCFKCGGWGYIDNVSESRTPLKEQLTPAKISRKKRKTRPVKKHIDLKVSSKLGSLFPDNIKSVIKKNMCSVCGKEIKDDYEHIPCLFHNNRVTKVNAGKSSEIVRVTKKKCLFCNENIHKHIINSHITKFHNNSSIEEKEKIKLALNLLFI